MHRIQAISQILICYLFGSVQFGYILAKLFLGKDVTKIGSKSTGTTNVLRLGNIPVGIATMACDVLKGFAPASIMSTYFPTTQTVFYTSLFACLMGHIFPILLKFKGGKGVATIFGIYLFIAPTVALISLFVYILVLMSFRISFIASLSMCVCFTCLELFVCKCERSTKIFLLIALCTVILRHKSNIYKKYRKPKQ